MRLVWEMMEVYKIVLCQELKAQSKSEYERQKQLGERINKLNNTVTKARNLLLTEAIDASDYRLIKNEMEDKIRKLEAKLSSTPIDHFNVDKILEKALNAFSRLDYLYLNSQTIRKREIISSIFPEKLIFDGFNYRTTRINEAVQLI